MATRLLTDDLRALVFSEIDLRFSEPKTRRKAFTILETAIACFDRKGFENVTFQMIARESGLTPPSLRHYFKTLDEIRETALKYIRLFVQKMGVQAMTSAEDPREMLKRYIHGHHEWCTKYPNQFRVWLSFLSYSSRKKADRQMNTLAVENGTKRIVQLMGDGRNQGVFRHTDDREAARVLQCVMLGWFTSLNTEEVANQGELYRWMMRDCFRIVGLEYKA